MRFEFYHESLAGAPLLSVDGTVDGALHLSHWEGNTTPEELRADTSTEIALNFAAWPGREEWARGVEVVEGAVRGWTPVVAVRRGDAPAEGVDERSTRL